MTDKRTAIEFVEMTRDLTESQKRDLSLIITSMKLQSDAWALEKKGA